MAKFRHEGNVLDWINNTAVAVPSGDIVKIGTADRYGVFVGGASGPLEPGVQGALRISGVWAIPAPGAPFGFGDDVLFNMATQTGEAGGVNIGTCVAVRGDVCDVLLNNESGSTSTR